MANGPNKWALSWLSQLSRYSCTQLELRTLLKSILAAFKPMKLKIGTHIAICKTSNRTKGFCAATLHHGDIRDLVVRAFVQSIMNFRRIVLGNHLGP